MTTADTTQAPSTVQTPRSLKPRACKPKAKRITLRALWALAPGQGLCDPAVPGLQYRRAPSGGASGRSTLRARFRYKHPITGKRVSVELARLPATEGELEADAMAAAEAGRTGWHVDDALEAVRARARVLRSKLRAGEDPKAEVGPGGYTLAQAKALHVAEAQRKGRSPLTLAEYELAARHLSDWQATPLRKLQGKAGREMVRARHGKIAREAGPVAANKTMRALRAWWNTARRADPELGESPTVSVQWFPERRRQSAIPLRDLPLWFEQVGKMENAVKRDLYLFVVLTGLRKTTACAARREHVDLGAGTLHIPKPKGGEARAFTVPLSDAALVVVKRRLAATNGPWLFPSATSESGHLEDPRPDPEADKVTVPFTPHGLRATFISAAHAAGVSDRHAQLLVNHAVHQSDVHGGYILPDPEALRPSQQKVTDYLREHGLTV